MAIASNIPNTHKGHGFRCVQAGNKFYLRAGAATCIEFKVSFELSRTSEFFFFKLPNGNIAIQILCSNLDKCFHHRSSNGVQMYVLLVLQRLSS